MSIAISATLAGCSAWVSSTLPNDSATTWFGYSGSPMEAEIVPSDGSGVVFEPYFGMTIHRLVANPASSKPVVPFPAFHIHTLRLWDVVSWAMLEPTNGQYDWTTMDQTIAIAKQNGVSDFVFTLGYVPAWASTNPAGSCGPEESAGSCYAPDMGAMQDFIAHMVQRYCGVVRYYETWNEPNLGAFWNGTDAQLLSVARNLYQTAKDPANCGCTNEACDPGGGINPNQVLLPSINSINQASLRWLGEYLAAGGKSYPYADIAAFHGYGYTQPEEIVQGVEQLRQTLERHGLAALEIWDTEASWGTSTDDDQEQEAAWLIRFHVAQAAAGVSRFIWYAYDNCAWGTLWGPACGNSTDNWQGVRLPGEAYANLEEWTVGATLNRCDQYVDGLWACEIRRPDGYEGWILWNSMAGATLSVRIPQSLGLTQYRDWQNNVSMLPEQLTVGQMPILVEN